MLQFAYCDTINLCLSQEKAREQGQTKLSAVIKISVARPWLVCTVHPAADHKPIGSSLILFSYNLATNHEAAKKKGMIDRMDRAVHLQNWAGKISPKLTVGKTWPRNGDNSFFKLGLVSHWVLSSPSLSFSITSLLLSPVTALPELTISEIARIG